MRTKPILTAAAALGVLALLAACDSGKSDGSKFPGGGNCAPSPGTAGGTPGGGFATPGTAGGTPGGAPGGTLEDGGACVGTSQNGEVVGADLLVLVDTSYSTDFPSVGSKFSAVRGALRTFVDETTSDTLGIGLQYFPLVPLRCDVKEYEKLTVDIGPIAQKKAAVKAALTAKKPVGGTPMAPALRGALNRAIAHAKANSSRRAVIVLATDGLPDGECEAFPNTMEEVARIAREGAEGAGGNPRIPTFVIAVGQNLAPLQAVATAAGTQLITVDTNEDVQEQFGKALQAIRKSAIGCAYDIPPAPAGQSIDYTRVNVGYRKTVDSPSESLPFVGNAAGCAASPRGWYYDNPQRPTKVIACNGVCEDALNQDNPRIDVVFGCKTIAR